MRGLQNSPKPSAWDSRLRVQSSAKAYRAQRAPWGQSSRRVLSLGSGDTFRQGEGAVESVLSGTPAFVQRGRRTIARLVSWDDEFGRLNLILLALALVAVAGHYAPPWFWLGS